MESMIKIDWDTLFMNMVYLVAMKSKDESTHIGAVIVGPDNEVRSVGFNSFPRGINDSIPERQVRPERYHWMAHGEANSVFNAAMAGIAVKGCKMYTNGVPCTSCVHAVINSGIKEVIVDKFWDDNNYNQWIEQAEKTKTMFKEAGVKLRFWEGSLVQIYRYRDGKILIELEKES
jgi:dCMP deaminase